MELDAFPRLPSESQQVHKVTCIKRRNRLVFQAQRDLKKVQSAFSLGMPYNL